MSMGGFINQLGYVLRPLVSQLLFVDTPILLIEPTYFNGVQDLVDHVYCGKVFVFISFQVTASAICVI